MDLTKKLHAFVRNECLNYESSHDWEHIQRVLTNARTIQESEGGDLELIEIACLLHDIADHKFNNHDFEIGAKTAYEIVLSYSKNHELAEKVSKIVQHVSFKGALVRDEELSLEGQIVRDADRLDAIGAIGIARAFAYGGHINQPLFNALLEPVSHKSAKQYAKAKTHTIAHFYEKLLLLKDRMETKKGKEIAEERHLFLCQYLRTFFKEIQFTTESTGFDLRGHF